MINFLLVTVDSLRADAVGTGLTHTIDELADEGVRFTNAFSNGYSTPVAFPAIQTGTYPDQYGGQEYMSEERPFLAQCLADAEYETAGFHSNPHLRRENNYDIGYQVYNDFDEQSDSLSSLRLFLSTHLDNYSWLHQSLRRVYHTFRTTSGGADYTKASNINEQALTWLDDITEPFFLWVHYMDVHYPFYPPDEFVKQAGHEPVSTSRAISLNGLMQENPETLSNADIRDLRSLYEGDVRYTDHHLGRLLDGLRAQGHDDGTAVVVTSDHGELFGEHGLFGHPPSVHNESVAVPLVAAGPGLPSGMTVDEQAALIDLPPTIAEYLDIDSPERWRGRSLPPVGRTGERPIVLGNERVLGCRADGWQLVRDHPDEGSVSWELWDLSADAVVDPDAYPEVTETLRQPINDYLAGMDETAESLPEVGADEQLQERLEALGYR